MNRVGDLNSHRKTKDNKKDIKNQEVEVRQPKKNVNKVERVKIENTKKVKKKKSRFKRFIHKLLLILIIAGIIWGIWFYKKIQLNGGGIKGALTTILGLSVENIDSLETINVLLLGISEDIDATLTDTIIVCSYNPENQNASMISIPRDTFVGKNKESAKGSDKINSIYSKNPEKLLKTVNSLTGLDIKYYAVVNTKALIEIVDIIGGVEFDVPINMDYDDPTQDLHIHLKKGMQKIDGEEAEQLLRFRHNNDGSSYPANYGDNDFGRMKTQRAFMTETAKQTLSLFNVFKSKKIIDTVFENVDMNFEIEDILPYIPTAVDFDVDKIENYQLPGKSERCNELWFFVHDSKETKELIKKLDI